MRSTSRASRSRALLATLVLTLAVSTGCAEGGSPTPGPDEGSSDGAGAAGRGEDGQQGRVERGWRSSDPDLGDGRYRDPLGPQRRMEVTPREWTEVFRDDFETLDTSVWKTYDGVPGCCPDARWDSSMVRVDDGSLFLDTAQVDGTWLSGGVGAWDTPFERQYGRWDVRVRTDADALGVTVGALLWPADGSWPPEIDFYEVFETQADRREMTVTNHYGEIDADGRHDATRRPVRGDFSRWRVMSLRWTPDEIQVLMDGRAVETITDDAQIPDLPMWLALQTAMKQVNGEDPTYDGVRSMQVDWVRAYAPA